MIIAIDGLCGIGKTSITKDLANMFGYQFLSIGYVFRAVTYIIEKYDDIDETCIEVHWSDILSRDPFDVYYKGEKITPYLHGDSSLASKCAQLSKRRLIQELVSRIITQLTTSGNWVLEGRSVDKMVKKCDISFYLTCSKEERRERLYTSMKLRGLSDEKSIKVVDEAEERNIHDCSRKVNPLRINYNNIIINSSLLKKDETLEIMKHYVNQYTIQTEQKNVLILQDSFKDEVDMSNLRKLQLASNYDSIWMHKSLRDLCSDIDINVKFYEVYGDICKEVCDLSIVYFCYSRSLRKLSHKSISDVHNQVFALVMVYDDESELIGNIMKSDIRQVSGTLEEGVTEFSLRGIYFKKYISEIKKKMLNRLSDRLTFYYYFPKIEIEKKTIEEYNSQTNDILLIKSSKLSNVMSRIQDIYYQKDRKMLIIVDASKSRNLRYIVEVLLSELNLKYLSNDYFKNSISLDKSVISVI